MEKTNSVKGLLTMVKWLRNQLDEDNVDWSKIIEEKGEILGIEKSNVFAPKLENDLYIENGVMEDNRKTNIEKIHYAVSRGDRESLNWFRPVSSKYKFWFRREVKDKYGNITSRNLDIYNAYVNSIDLIKRFVKLYELEYQANNSIEIEEVEKKFDSAFGETAKVRMEDMQSICTYLSKFLKDPDGQQSEKSSKSQNGEKEQKAKKGPKKTSKVKRSGKKSSSAGADRTELAPPFDLEHLAWAKKILNKFLTVKTVWEKDFKKMIPFLYGHLQDLAPYKSEEVKSRIFLIVQNNTSGYYGATAKKRDRALLAIAEDMGNVVVHKYYKLYESVQEVTKGKRPTKDDVLLISTSGCSGASSNSEEFYRQINKFPGKVEILTNWDQKHGTYCGCSTFRELPYSCPKCIIAWGALKSEKEKE